MQRMAKSLWVGPCQLNLPEASPTIEEAIEVARIIILTKSKEHFITAGLLLALFHIEIN